MLPNIGSKVGHLYYIFFVSDRSSYIYMRSYHNLGNLYIWHSYSPFALCILRVVLIEIVGVFLGNIISVTTPPARTIPEMECLAVHAIRSGDDLDEIAACDFNGRDFGRR